MIQQLRIYEIFENNKAAFHARFRDHAARIMTGRYGFKFASMWETKFGDRTEFVYLLEWPDEGDQDRAMGSLHGRSRMERDQAGHPCRARPDGRADR
ncbi:hypothetical protein [Bradyrhizobium embrapense]|uniref:hypothetical protein n=1 Tax=Bradyrhizobium embrapense TaxID=630921 RepID=UPI000B14BC4C|nr:hypothetical protein [Bradyrhizobium embrapense]